MRNSNFVINGAFIVAINLATYGAFLSYTVSQKPSLQPFENFKRYAYNYINAHVSATKVSALESDPEEKVYIAPKGPMITLPMEAKDYLNDYYALVSQSSEQSLEGASVENYSTDLGRIKHLKKTIKLAVQKGSIETRTLIFQNLEQFYRKLDIILSHKEIFAKAFSLKNKSFLTHEIYGGGVDSPLVDYDLKDLLCEFRKEVYMEVLYGNHMSDSYFSNPIKLEHRSLKKLQAFIGKLERSVGT